MDDEKTRDCVFFHEMNTAKSSVFYLSNGVRRIHFTLVTFTI